MPQTLLEMAKDLVLAQIQAKRLPPDEMHTALQQTYTSLKVLQAQEPSYGDSVPGGTLETQPKPVDWRETITKHNVSEVWSQLQATLGETSQGTWVRWTVVSSEIRHSSYTIVSRQRDHVETEGDRAEVAPWEKAPMFLKAQEEKERQPAQVAPRKRTRRKGG